MSIKKILVAVIVLVLAAGIVAAGMLLRGRSPGADSGVNGGLPVGTLPLPGVGTGSGSGDGGGFPGGDGAPGGGLPGDGFGAVSQALVLDYTANNDGEIFLIDAGGAVISTSSTEPIIARANFGALLGAWFSPGAQWLLVRSGSEDSPRWSILDVPSRTWKDAAANTSEMFWSPDGRRLAYFARRTNGTTLTTLDPATGSTVSLLAMSAPDLTLRWRDSGHIFILDRPSALFAGNVWSLSLDSGALSPFATGVSGADVLWGDENSGGLLFRSGPTGGVLALVDAQANTSQIANFLTLTSKCVFGAASSGAAAALEDYLFCAIPRDANLLKNSRLPDDYLQRKFVTSDTLHAVDLTSGGIFPLSFGSASLSFDAADLSVYGESLYFVNQLDRKLYRAPLTALVDLEAEAEVGVGVVPGE